MHSGLVDYRVLATPGMHSLGGLHFTVFWTSGRGASIIVSFGGLRGADLMVGGTRLWNGPAGSAPDDPAEVEAVGRAAVAVRSALPGWAAVLERVREAEKARLRGLM